MKAHVTLELENFDDFLAEFWSGTDNLLANSNPNFIVETDTLDQNQILNQFKQAIEEHCDNRLWGQRSERENLWPDFNWQDAMEQIPKEDWEKHGISPTAGDIKGDNLQSTQIKVDAKECVISQELSKEIQQSSIVQKMFDKLRDAEQEKPKQHGIEAILAKLKAEKEPQVKAPAKNDVGLDR